MQHKTIHNHKQITLYSVSLSLIIIIGGLRDSHHGLILADDALVQGLLGRTEHLLNMCFVLDLYVLICMCFCLCCLCLSWGEPSIGRTDRRTIGLLIFRRRLASGARTGEQEEDRRRMIGHTMSISGRCSYIMSACLTIYFIIASHYTLYPRGNRFH